jgi:hypothetical protein
MTLATIRGNGPTGRIHPQLIYSAWVRFVVCRILAEAAGHLNAELPPTFLEMMQDNIPAMLPNTFELTSTYHGKKHGFKVGADRLFEKVIIHRQRLHEPERSVCCCWLLLTSAALCTIAPSFEVNISCCHQLAAVT